MHSLFRANRECGDAYGIVPLVAGHWYRESVGKLVDEGRGRAVGFQLHLLVLKILERSEQYPKRQCHTVTR